ncbi:hypothetical protein C2E20_0054 [Micractinium conductrix]|uniref:Uncharacterized protein n=1 Tax=Micractinium conductrix TaxID=554055 RepID=A0A2P6VQN6_9CHLO|nr:hypothetical protein C2E20_0054 [Micractinium conductrix]|eukprot:PSC76408.1 hypothetical protein C2E20_0054 [Micractinium conductrix]
MVNPALWAGGAALALPVAATVKAVVGRGGKPKAAAGGVEPRLDDADVDSSFVCERVCTSPRLMRRMGSLAKDATPNTCVTVCGTSQEDACTDACQRAVCTTVHQVPAWNEDCLKHCRLECQRGRTS